MQTSATVSTSRKETTAQNRRSFSSWLDRVADAVFIWPAVIILLFFSI